ncbi:hypothetical protein ABT063_02930 [Streptomyces sp. NPDC002838]|uniref:hypothetical protein n=1 Tax=Streptomyces sp. NPDC002838 TaxID=3154436 RepID=UPI003329ED46
MDNVLLDRYEGALRPARERLAGNRAMRAVLDTDTDPRTVELMLTAYAVNGVAMVEPVEGWIRRAAERCLELGYQELGDALLRHAKSEAGHHRMMLSDLRLLTDSWNGRGLPPLDPDELLARPPRPAVRQYIDLHEDAIAGPTPFVQIAIEYEIENLSAQYGSIIVEGCKARLGDGVHGALSFLVEHAKADVGHTLFNRRQMAGFLERNPAALDDLVAAGTRALDVYGRCLDECLQFATDFQAEYMPVP